MYNIQPFLLISLVIITVVLSFLVLNVNAIIVNNTDFSVNVSDNWAYLDSNNPLGKTFGSNNPLANIFGGGPWIAAIPNEFSKLLVNTSQEFSAKAVQNGGAYSVFAIDTGYPYRNVPLEIYTEYANNLSRAKIFSRENTTIGGEQAIRIHRIPLDNTPNVEVVAYYSVHKGKPYWINYVANEKDFQKYLPQFEQMVRTFKFVN